MSLHDIQQAVHVAKDKKNEFGGYNYRTAEGILSAVKAALPEGATVVVSDTLCEFAGQIFVSATATITLADNVQHSATGHAMHQLNKKGMDQAQITGAASSYARKYALAGLLALDDGSADPDTQDNRKADEERQAHASAEARQSAIGRLMSAPDLAALATVWKSLPPDQKRDPEIIKAKDEFKAGLQPDDLDGDDIPEHLK